MKIKMLTAAAVSALLPMTAAAGTVTTDGPDLKLSTKGGLKVATADKKYSVKLGGRIQYDYNQSEFNDETDEDDFNIRRARLKVSGNVHDWSYAIQFNVNDGVETDVEVDPATGLGEGEGSESGGTPEDLYIQYNGFGKGAVITIGNHKIGSGLEEVTSSKDVSFLERNALTELYAVGKQEGISVKGKKGNFTYQVSGFEFGSSDSDFGAAARATFGPQVEGAQLHAGISYADLPNDDDRLGLELAAVLGPLHAQAEFFDREVGDVDQDGYYLQVGYVLTGEARPYKGGKFKKVKPSGKGGAWEVVARYVDGDGNFSDVELGGDEASEWGLGVNWYANNNVRIGATYSEGDSDTSDDDGSEFRARFQFTF